MIHTKRRKIILEIGLFMNRSKYDYIGYQNIIQSSFGIGFIFLFGFYSYILSFVCILPLNGVKFCIHASSHQICDIPTARRCECYGLSDFVPILKRFISVAAAHAKDCSSMIISLFLSYIFSAFKLRNIYGFLMHILSNGFLFVSLLL